MTHCKVMNSSSPQDKRSILFTDHYPSPSFFFFLSVFISFVQSGYSVQLPGAQQSLSSMQLKITREKEHLKCSLHRFIKVRQQRVYFKVWEKSWDARQSEKNRRKTFQRPGNHSNNCQVQWLPNHLADAKQNQGNWMRWRKGQRWKQMQWKTSVW